MRRGRLSIFFGIVILTIINGCAKINIISPNNPNPTDTIVKPPTGIPSTSFFLGHKGAGSNNYNDVNMEHSIASFKESLGYLDGVEIDAQMSLDGTIWLFHDVDVNASLCNPGVAHKGILTMHDNEIANLKLCAGTKKDRVYKFSELIELWNSSPKGFFIDVEVKEGFDAVDYIPFGGEKKYLQHMATSFRNEFQNLAHDAKSIEIEDYDTTLTNKLKSYAVGKKLTYFLNDGTTFTKNVANAIKGHFDGVEVIFTDSTVSKQAVKAAHDKGLLVSLYTPDTEAEVRQVYSLLPDFITTDYTTVKVKLGLK